MDFLKLPKDYYGFNNYLVIINRLSKASWYVPYSENVTTKDAAKIYYEGPYRIFGAPTTVVSDRGL